MHERQTICLLGNWYCYSLEHKFIETGVADTRDGRPTSLAYVPSRAPECHRITARRVWSQQLRYAMKANRKLMQVMQATAGDEGKNESTGATDTK